MTAGVEPGRRLAYTRRMVRCFLLAVPAATLALALFVGPAGGQGAFEPGMDPRRAGGPPSPDELGGAPLDARVGSPDRGLWADAKVPDGRVDPRQALHGARAEAGLHLDLPAPEGVAIALDPRIAVRAPPSAHEAAGFGGALAEHVNVPLPHGLRLRVDGTEGDRASLGLPDAPGDPHFAGRLSVVVATELPAPDGGGPLQVEFGVSSTVPLGPQGDEATPGPCTIGVDVGRGGTHLHLGARCAGTGQGDAEVVEFSLHSAF